MTDAIQDDAGDDEEGDSNSHIADDRERPGPTAGNQIPQTKATPPYAVPNEGKQDPFERVMRT
jgi:hypothetical protein